jgi:esterase/lipase
MSAEGLVDATAVVGTPLRLPRLIRWGLPVVMHLHPFLEKKTGASISDERARARHPGFPVMPLASVHQLVLLQRIVEDGLAKISTPLLVAHGARDTTANPGDARLIFDGVPSEHRELHMFERSAHIVPVDHEGAELADSVARFFGKHLG